LLKKVRRRSDSPEREIRPSGDKGVAIVGVDPNGRGAAKGLGPSDSILAVGGKPVSTPGEVESDIAAARQGAAKAIVMRIQTDEGDRFVAFAFPKA
jgi:serine protease Do